MNSSTLLALLFINLCVFAGDIPAATFVYTNHVEENLFPCDCGKNPLGGVSRRSRIIDDLRNDSNIVYPLDGGNLLLDGNGTGKLKFEYLVRAMNEMKYSAATPGVNEIRAGYEFIKWYSSLAEFPVVSANVVLPDTTILTESAVLSEKDNIYVTGVTDTNIFGAGITFKDPFESIKIIIDKLAPGSLLVVLGHIPSQLAEKIASLSTPSRRLLILGYSSLKTDLSPVSLHGAMIGGVSGKGRHILITSWIKSKSFWSLKDYRITSLTSDISKSDVMEKLIKEFYKTLERLKLPVSSPPPYQRFIKEGRYTGSYACKSCHPEHFKRWLLTPHSWAYEVLEKEARYNPDCVKCHTVGVGSDGGFNPYLPEEEKKGVGCEVCHGPGEDHDKLISSPPDELCFSCHTGEKSPGFKPLKTPDYIPCGDINTRMENGE